MQVLYLIYYCGPNRRSDATMVEILLQHTPQDLEAISAGRAAAGAYLAEAFERCGMALPEHGFDPGSLEPLELFSRWCSAIGLSLQTCTGHRVSRDDAIFEPLRRRCAVLFEHEESQVGEKSGWLALRLLSRAFPNLAWSGPEVDDGRDFQALFDEFREFSEALVLPADTQAIIRAAGRAGVPVVKLERDPYEPVQGAFRIRMNSMLMLGHAVHRQVLDGWLALEKIRFDPRLVTDRGMALQAMAAQGLPVTAAGPAVPPEPGETYRLIFANHRLTGVLDGAGQALDAARLDAVTVERLAGLSRKLGTGLVMFTLVTPDPGQPLEAAGGKLTGMEVSPELDRYTEKEPGLLEAAAEGYLEWLFPPGTPSRIPIVGITGTNGKTTTSSMINHVLHHAGKNPGLVCTEGVYVDGERLGEGDLASLMGHNRVFENRSADLAVFETHHHGLARYGLSFEWCDVAVVTNVSSDHLGVMGIETVADMAVLKRSLLERARHMAVLNADDPHCLAMIPHARAEQLLLTSLATPGAELLKRHAAATGCVVVEAHQGAEWIVLRTNGASQPVIAVSAIPATFNGAAAFNTENALQAVAACHGLGVEIEVIAKALAGFSSSTELTPGRLNVYEGLPFGLIVDFAHNADGLEKLMAFTDQLTAQGRKVVAVASSGDRSQAHHETVVALLAGHFDYYICREYLQLRGREPGEMSALVRELLIENGVRPEQIGQAPGGPESLRHVLALCEAGDLLIFLRGTGEHSLVAGNIKRYLEHRESRPATPTGSAR
jgi:UDP-N-acetylmuramyl tripeptide synthase